MLDSIEFAASTGEYVFEDDIERDVMRNGDALFGLRRDFCHNGQWTGDLGNVHCAWKKCEKREGRRSLCAEPTSYLTLGRNR